MSEQTASLVNEFRLALRRMGASVTIISTEMACVRYGIVATAVMSMSMDPPTMAVGINKTASIHDPLKDRGTFAINILSEWDQPVAAGFARAAGEDRFANGPWSHQRYDETHLGRIPYLANSLASIFCTVRDIHSCGSHSLFVGEVASVIRSDEISPLIYCDGSYGSFIPSGPSKLKEMHRDGALLATP